MILMDLAAQKDMGDTYEPNPQTSYFKSLPCDDNYTRTITDRLRELANEAPDKMAFVFRSPHKPRSSLTRQEFLDKITKLGLHFVHLGIKPGEKVAILMSSSEYFLLVQFGLCMVGAVAVNSLSQDATELYKMATDLGCAAKIVENMDSTGNETNIELYLPQNQTELPAAADIKCLLQSVPPKGVSLPALSPDAEVLMVLTSGSTGTQKLVTHTHASLLFGAYLLANSAQYTAFDSVANDRPMQWLGGYPLVFLGAGSPMIYIISQLAKAEDDAFFVDVLASENPTSLVLMDYRLKGIYSKSELLSKMPPFQSISTGGQRMTLHTLHLLLQLCSEVKLVYGSTECLHLAVALFRDTENWEDGYIGKFGRGSEVKIINDEGLTLPILEVGELCIRGDGCAKQYVSLTGKPRNILDDDNWYHTGDMAVMKTGGHVVIKGRTTEMIKRATRKIFPAIIERQLMENFDVMEVVVVGIPDKKLHQELCACIILKLGSALTLDGIKRRAEEIFKPSLAPDGLGLMPGHFLIMDDFPRTISSKCSRHHLVQKVAAMLHSETSST